MREEEKIEECLLKQVGLTTAIGVEYINHVKEAMQEYAEWFATEKKEDVAIGCPCLYLKEPCQPRCTCVDNFSSHGCYNCCTYGSVEQRTAHAEKLNNYRLEKKEDGWYSKEQVDYMLNEVLVGILCTKYYEVDRNSNGISQFVIEYLDKQKPK